MSLNLRWLPHVVSARQAAGADAVRIKFGFTQHEALAQSPGTNTFYFDADRKVWKVMGEKETGAPVGETGLRVEKSLALSLGPIMGGNLKPGLYRLELLMVQPSAAGEGVVEIELGGSPVVKDRVDVAARAGGKGKMLSLVYTVEIAAAAPEVTLRPVRGAVYAGGVSLAPAAGW